MHATECNTWQDLVERLPDPRARRGRRYQWGTLVLLICAALLSGQHTGAAIAQWISDHAAEWQGWAPTSGGRIPSAATVRRTLRQVDPAALERVLSEWIGQQLGVGDWAGEQTGDRGAATVLRAVAIDGKAVRGAQTHGAKVHLVSAVTHTHALTLAQCAVEAKSNEIPAVQRLLAGRDLRGWVVTLDAMHTQRATADLILRQGGHYLMVVKQNQPTLYATLDEWFACSAIAAEQEECYETSGKAHGRLERRSLRRRRLTCCGQVDWLDFPGVRQGLARRGWARTLASGQERGALTFGLTSLSPEQAGLAELEALWRGHWTIENRSHYVRDVTCGEDARQAWTGQTPHALAALHNGVLALLRLAGWTNMAAAFRAVGASVSRAFTLLGCQPRHLARL